MMKAFIILSIMNCKLLIHYCLRKEYRLVLLFPETLSEAVKMLKGEYCVRAINEHKMDRAIIFCRTKLDCDNLEKYLNQIGQ
jgi:superfamily II DNA/RNA helicase